MLRLRFPKLWLGMGWLLVLGVCVGSLLPAPVVHVLSHDKITHFVSYFVLTVWFCGLYGKARHYIAIAAVLIALGAALDLLQGTTATRQFDIYDVLANAGGVLLGALLAVVFIGGWCRQAERWLVR
jgi:VanZ family protein